MTWLERNFPDEYGRNQRVEIHTSRDESPADLVRALPLEVRALALEAGAKALRAEAEADASADARATALEAGAEALREEQKKLPPSSDGADGDWAVRETVKNCEDR